jgi:hypothetical protein
MVRRHAKARTQHFCLIAKRQLESLTDAEEALHVHGAVIRADEALD